LPERFGAETAALLDEGLEELGYGAVGDLGERLLAYLRLLFRWNSACNLTAVRDPAEMVTRHLLDSLAVAPHLPDRAPAILDVGTGAGLPGIPLALLFPDRRFTLLDSNGKKTRFLFQVKTRLGLANMSVQRARAEAWTPRQRFDVVLSRAFASLPEMANRCAHLLNGSGCFLAMKGVVPERELADVEASCEVRGVYPLRVPGLEEARHLIALRPIRAGVRGN